MQDKVKQRIAAIRKSIQQKQYQQAIDDCDYVFIMLSNKIASVHLFAGFCHQKLNSDAKAEKEYKEAEDLQPENIDCFKALYSLYSRLRKSEAAKYLQKLCKAYKKTDRSKFRQHYIKLVKYYEADKNLDIILGMIKDMMQTEKQVTPEMVALGEAYFNLSTSQNKDRDNEKKEKSFDISIIGSMGQDRILLPQSKESLDYLLIKSIKYLKGVAGEYEIQPIQISESIMYLKGCYPESGAVLYLLLTDEYAVTHVEMVEILMTQIYLFLSAYFKLEEPIGQNYYTNAQFIHPQIFLAQMILSYEYLAFFCEFFNIAEPMKPLYQKLAQQQHKLREEFRNEQLKNYVQEFVLTEALQLSRCIDSENSHLKLNRFRDRAKKLAGFVEQVVARLAMKVFKDYKELTDMKNVLKVRIGKEPNNIFLLKYYYDYLIRISKSYKVFDEDIDVEDILDKIMILDADDYRYRSERAWMRFSQAVYANEPDLSVFMPLHQQMKELSLRSGISQQDVAAIRKKILIVEIHCKLKPNVTKDLLQILSLDPRNYHTYMCLGVAKFVEGSLQEALDYFRRGFLIYQRDYHLNRHLYMCLIKLGLMKEASDFAQKIYPGFKHVYWLNYVIAINCLNNRQYESAETYLTKAIEVFTLNKTRTYDLSYEKLHERDDYTSPYLIRQNKYRILDQYISVPEQAIFDTMPLISNYYYKESKSPVILIEIRMWVQIAQILKILGRLATALKCLMDTKSLAEKEGLLRKCEKWTINAKNEQMFLQTVLLFKELATVLYYCNNIKDAYAMLENSMRINSKLTEYNKAYNKLAAELLALKFQISIEKLTVTMRFQSYETTSGFIRNMKIPECTTPTVPYLKSFYQYTLLCYLHNHEDCDRCLHAISAFLRHFGLDYNNIRSVEFSNIYFSLRQDDRKQVKQAVEDMLILLYIVELNHDKTELTISKQYILNVLEIFPDSTIMYILYGILEKDIAIKTGAFLKCIEIDKNNAASVDYLAYLYLQNRNIMAAAKLYLKSVELNPLNLKSYVGLTVTLISIFIRCLADSKTDYTSIIQASMSKVRAYLEYMKVTNPTIQYTLIDFFQLLLGSEASSSHFEKTLRLDSGLGAYAYMKRTGKAVQNHFIDKVLEDIPLGQLWTEDGNKLLEIFSKQYELKTVDIGKDSELLIEKIVQSTKETIRSLKTQLGLLPKEIQLKQIQHLYSKVSAALILSNKFKLHGNKLSQILDMLTGLKELQSSFSLPTLTNQNVRDLKIRLLNYSLTCSDEIKGRIENLFEDVQTPEYHMRQALKHGEDHFRQCVTKEMMKNPTSEVARRHLHTILTIRYRKYTAGRMKESAKSRVLNESLQSPEKRVQALTKLVMLYNDPSGWLMLIYEKYSKISLRTKNNLEYWLKLLRTNSIFKANNHKLSDHSQKLFVEIYVWLEAHYGVSSEFKQIIEDTVSLKRKYEEFIKQSKAITTLSPTTLSKTTIGSLPMHILNVIISRYIPTRQLQSQLDQLTKLSLPAGQKGYLGILRFISAIKAQHSQSLDEYEKSVALQQSIPQYGDPVCHMILLMTVSLIMKNYTQLDQLLTRLSYMTITGSHEVLLACYFDIMLAYQKLMSAPEDSDLFDNFKNYIEKTLSMSEHQPEFSSFLHYLYGLVLLKIGDMYGISKEDARRSIFKSIWLNPIIGKQIVKKVNRNA